MTRPEDQAFPVHENEYTSGAVGLTKREFFAAMAMQGILTNPGNPLSEGPSIARSKLSNLSDLACRVADALLAELEKKK